MFKKIIGARTARTFVLVLAFTLVLSSVSVVYGDSYSRRAQNIIKKDNFQIISIDSSKTFQKERSIYIKGEQGMAISLLLYWLKPTQEKSILSLDNKEDFSSSEALEDGEWIKYDSKSLTIEEAGFSAETVTLKIGKNKLIFNAKNKEGKKEVKEVYIEVTDEQELTDAISDVILRNIEKKFLQ